MRLLSAVVFAALALPSMVGFVAAKDLHSSKASDARRGASAKGERQARLDANGNAVRGVYDRLVAKHATANGIPEALVHRVIMRESRYNPRAVSRGNYGIMQIRLGTARALGYRGTAQGLLDADTNMTYAVRYLAGAYRVAGGNHDRAVSLYARGYYYEAKRKGINAYALARPDQPAAPLVLAQEANALPPEEPAAVEAGSGSFNSLEDRFGIH